MARNEQQNQRMREARRAQILSHALRLFVERGLVATKISDIARSSGISQGLLYHYYRSKEDVYVELIRHAFERMNEAVRVLESLPLSPREKITKAVVELLAGLKSTEDFSRYFLLTAGASVFSSIPAEATAIVEAHRDEPYRAIARILRHGQKDGSVCHHDADELAVVFWTMIKGLAMQRAAFGERYRAPDPQILLRVFFEEEQK